MWKNASTPKKFYVRADRNCRLNHVLAFPRTHEVKLDVRAAFSITDVPIKALEV